MSKKICQYLDEVFPPPKYLTMPSLSIDLSDSFARYIVFEKKNNYSVIKYFGAEKIPAGLITGGIINDKKAISEILSRIRVKTGLDFVNMTLPEERAYLFKMQIPKVKDSEMREAISFRIEENVPVPAKEAVFDYKIINRNDNLSDHADVVVSLVPEKLSSTYSEVAVNAGLMPLKFEIVTQAIAKAVTPLNDTRVFLIMNFTENKTSFSIVSDKNVFFSSTVPYGSLATDAIIAKKFKIDISEVDKIKSQILGSGKQNMSLFMEIMNELDPLKEEIAKLSVYWKTHSMALAGISEPIDKIILCGKDTVLPAVDEYISGVSNIKTEVANVWQNFFSLEEYIPLINYKDSLDYAAVVGVSIN
jgi:Tfp pilus assembly PilM family ATPase